MSDVDEEQRINRLFGSYLYIFPSLLLFLGLTRTIWTAVRNSKVGFSVDAESQNPSIRKTYPPSALTNGFKRWIMYPALFGGRHRQPIGWYTFPTRVETVLVASYWLINIIFLVVRRGEVGKIDGTKLIADRAGVLSLWNMPIFFLLAGRNDFLVWLTGWPYGTFHVFHKWIARVSALMAMVHSVAYAVYMYQIGDEARRWNPAYWWNGVSAMIVMGLILCLAVFPFRKKAYEFFIFCHILGVIMFLIFLYYHLKLSATGAYHPWIWACVGMWAFDRFTRLLRLLILNFGAFSKNPQNHHLARAKFVKGTDVIQLTVYPSAEDVGYFPGAHYFVFLTGTWRFWECHPFTAAGWRAPGAVLTAMPQNAPRMKRSLQGSLNDSLRVPRLPPRAKLSEKHEKHKDMSDSRRLATLKELGLLKDVSDERPRRPKGTPDIFGAGPKRPKGTPDLLGGGGPKRPKGTPDILSGGVKKPRDASDPRGLATLKELGLLKDLSGTGDVGVTKESKRDERTVDVKKVNGHIYIIKEQGKETSPTPVPGMPERKPSAKKRLREKEMAKARAMRGAKPEVKKKTSNDSDAKVRPKGSDTDTDRGEDKDSELESEKLTDTNEESEKLDPSEEDATEDIEKEEPEKVEEAKREKEKKTLTTVIVVEEEAEEDEDAFVEIDQGALSSIASTTRKGLQRPKLTFFIKPRKGMTQDLANKIREHEELNKTRGFPRGRELEIKCLIEGAYGVNHPLHLYETVVLIAGGVGITTILPYLVDYMERARGPEKRTLTRRLVFLWTAKEEELVENLVARKFPKGCLTRADISMQLYVTKIKKDQEFFLPGVKYKRPKIPEILFSEQKRLVGRMAVMSCGPSVLVDIVRSAVVGCLDAERKHIEYFEESY